MSMNITHLVTMANQIGEFFLSYPNQEEAKKEIANHLRRFWAPQMRQQIVQHLADHDQTESGLHPLVSTAIKEYLH